MTNILIKLMTALNVFIYRLSAGYIGSKLGRQSVLLLHTVGRKSGKSHDTSLSYYRDGNNYLLVGSNWGKESHPGWYYNLMNQPHSTIQVGTHKINIEAHLAEGDEYQRLWKLVTEKNDQYIRYQKRMKRRLPIIILTPAIAA